MIFCAQAPRPQVARSKRRRMRGLRDAAVGGDAQAFLFQADLAAAQYFADVATQQVGDAIFDVRRQLDFQAFE